MIFTIQNESNNKTNTKKFTDLVAGYSIRFTGSHNCTKKVGYLYRRNLSTETLIISEDKLHFQFQDLGTYHSYIVDDIGNEFDFFINIDYKRHKFTYFNGDKVVSFDFKPDYPKVVDENNYFTFLADNIHEKTTDENLLEGELSRLVIYDRPLEPHEISFNLKRDVVLEEEGIYTSLDMETKTNFKIFDNSGNGNHGLISEPVKFKHDKIMDFVSKARPNKYG
jgi:hypothetical protein